MKLRCPRCQSFVNTRPIKGNPDAHWCTRCEDYTYPGDETADRAHIRDRAENEEIEHPSNRDPAVFNRSWYD